MSITLQSIACWLPKAAVLLRLGFLGIPLYFVRYSASKSIIWSELSCPYAKSLSNPIDYNVHSINSNENLTEVYKLAKFCAGLGLKIVKARSDSPLQKNQIFQKN